MAWSIGVWNDGSLPIFFCSHTNELMVSLLVMNMPRIVTAMNIYSLHHEIECTVTSKICIEVQCILHDDCVLI